MAIRSTEQKKDGSDEKELQVTIDNGDLQLVDSLVGAYSFKDRDSLFKFAIAALLQGNNYSGLYTIQKKEDGNRIIVGVSPANDLIKKEE